MHLKGPRSGIVRVEECAHDRVPIQITLGRDPVRICEAVALRVLKMNAPEPCAGLPDLSGRIVADSLSVARVNDEAHLFYRVRLDKATKFTHSQVREVTLVRKVLQENSDICLSGNGQKVIERSQEGIVDATGYGRTARIRYPGRSRDGMNDEVGRADGPRKPDVLRQDRGGLFAPGIDGRSKYVSRSGAMDGAGVEAAIRQTVPEPREGYTGRRCGDVGGPGTELHIAKASQGHSIQGRLNASVLKARAGVAHSVHGG
jgi:hypothetical protein